VLNSCRSGTSDGPDLRCTFEIASHDSFSCNYKANVSVTLSRRRSACKSHAGSFEIGVFSSSIAGSWTGYRGWCWFWVASRRRLYGTHGERGSVIPGGNHSGKTGPGQGPAKD